MKMPTKCRGQLPWLVWIETHLEINISRSSFHYQCVQFVLVLWCYIKSRTSHIHGVYFTFFFLCNTVGNRLFLFWFWLVLNKQNVLGLEGILYLLFSLIMNIKIKSPSRLFFINPSPSFLVFHVCWWLTQSRGTVKVSCRVICEANWRIPKHIQTFPSICKWSAEM